MLLPMFSYKINSLFIHLTGYIDISTTSEIITLVQKSIADCIWSDLLKSEVDSKIHEKSKLSDIFIERTDGVVIHSVLNISQLIPLSEEESFISKLHMTVKGDITGDVSETYDITTKIWVCSLFFSFTISKEYWDKIMGRINKYENNEVIEFRIKPSTNHEEIPLYEIECVNKENVIIHSPQKHLDINYIGRVIETNLYFCRGIYLEYFFTLIDSSPYRSPDLVKSLHETGNVILRLFDSPILLMYIPEYFSRMLIFFDDVLVKLVIVGENDIITYPQTNYISKPKMGIEFSRKKNTKFPKINIQVTKNLIFTTRGVFRDKNHHINIDFHNRTINFATDTVDVYISYEFTESSYDVILGFPKSFKDSVLNINETFENSLKLIKIETYGEGKNPEISIIDTFSCENNEKTFKIKFNIKKNSENKKDSGLYNILENKEGYFTIQVQTSNKIIMDYKIIANGVYMHVLSSNILQEHITSLDGQSESRHGVMSQYNIQSEAGFIENITPKSQSADLCLPEKQQSSSQRVSMQAIENDNTENIKFEKLEYPNPRSLGIGKDENEQKQNENLHETKIPTLSDITDSQTQQRNNSSKTTEKEDTYEYIPLTNNSETPTNSDDISRNKNIKQKEILKIFLLFILTFCFIAGLVISIYWIKANY